MTYTEHHTLLGPEIERCPVCGGPLVEERGHTRCSECHRIGTGCCEGVQGTCTVPPDSVHDYKAPEGSE